LYGKKTKDETVAGKPKTKICENGPYLIHGGISLTTQIIGTNSRGIRMNGVRARNTSQMKSATFAVAASLQIGPLATAATIQKYMNQEGMCDE
jgi:hypothetical protein